jgi:hypothetical protein
MDDTYRVYRDENAILFEAFARDDSGDLICVAQCLHFNKDTSVYSQILQDIEQCTKCVPDVVMVDQDQAVIAALQECWPTTEIQYCIYHDKNNIQSHFRGTIQGNMQKEEREEYISKFTTDLNYCLYLPTEDLTMACWDLLVLQYGTTTNFRRYLQNKKTDLIRIAAFNKIQKFDYGRLSTSDAETGHKSTKDTLRTMAGYHIGCQSAHTFLHGVKYFLEKQMERDIQSDVQNKQRKFSMVSKLSETESKIFGTIIYCMGQVNITTSKHGNH